MVKPRKYIIVIYNAPVQGVGDRPVAPHCIHFRRSPSEKMYCNTIKRRLFDYFTAVRIVLRGKAHAEWQVLVSGDRSAVKDDQYFIDNRSLIFGKGKKPTTKRTLLMYLLIYFLIYLFTAYVPMGAHRRGVR